MPSLTFVATRRTRSATRAPRRSSPTSRASTRPWLSAEAAAAAITDAHPGDHEHDLRRPPGRQRRARRARRRARADPARGRRARRSAAASAAGTSAPSALAGAFSFFSNKNLAGRRGRDGGDRRRRDRGAGAAAALARDDVAHLGPPPRSRERLRRGRARASTTGSTSRARRWPRRGWSASTRTTRAAAAAADALPRAARAASTASPPTMPDAADAQPGAPPVHGRARRGIDRDAFRARRSPSAASRRACTTRPYTASRPTGSDADLPLTEDYARRAVTLPLFPTITEEQIEWVADSLERAAAFVRD